MLRFLERKSILGPDDVLAHRFTRCFRLAGSDGAIDFSMELEGFVEIVCALNRRAASLVKDCRNHLDECRERRIARSSRDGAMKRDVVHKKLLRIP